MMQQTELLDVVRAIHTRRSVREYAPVPVERALLEQLIVDATQAPSAMNLQPWAFAVFTGVEQLRAFSERARHCVLVKSPDLESLVPPGVNMFHDAPALVVICAVNERPQSIEDCSLAAENLMLSAHARGLGTCPIGLSRAWLNLPQIKSELGIAREAQAVFPVVVGYPKARTGAPGRNAPLYYTWR